jgi:hypothetical protein
MRGQQKSRKARRGANQKDPEKHAELQIEKIASQGRILKRVLITSSTVSTGAGGFIGVTNVASSSNVSSAINWGSYQAIAVEYRVTGIELEIFPVVNSNTVTASPAPTMLAACAYSSDTVPSSWSTVAQGPGSKSFSGMERCTFACDTKGFPGCRLWIPIASAPTLPNVFGVVIADPGTAPASAAVTVYFRILIRYLTEFRSLT